MLKCFVNNSPTLSKRTVRRQCLKIKLYFNDYLVTYFRDCCFHLNILMTTQKVRYKQTIKNNLTKIPFNLDCLFGSLLLPLSNYFY